MRASERIASENCAELRGARQLEKVGALLEREGEVPVGGRRLVDEVRRVGHLRHPERAVGAQPVLDPAAPRAGERERVHHALEEGLVDRLERRQRVRRELDRPAEPRELARLLVHRHVEARLQHRQRRRQPADAAARDRHLERPVEQRARRRVRLHLHRRRAVVQPRAQRVRLWRSEQRQHGHLLRTASCEIVGTHDLVDAAKDVLSSV